MFTEIRGRGDDLSLADVVVGQEDNLQEIANVLVVIHHRAHGVDQMNNLLRHPVAGRSLSSEDRDTRDNLLAFLRGE